MHRLFSKKFQTTVISLQPGEFIGTKNGPILSTVLGSCVTACIFDEVNEISGMNHIMLPRIFNSEDILTSDIGRYGMFAMELLTGDLIKLGAQRNHLKAKVFGGASLIGKTTQQGVARANIEFVRKYLTMEEIPIVAEDLGGSYGRKIFFFTINGKVYVKKLSHSWKNKIRQKEELVRESVMQQKETEKSFISFS